MYTSIKIKNYKCFVNDRDSQGFETIKPINVIIGKNNSGKSKLLEALKAIVENDDKGLPFQTLCQHKLSSDELKKIFPQNVRSIASSLSYYGNDWDDIGQYLVGKEILFQQIYDTKKLIDINIDGIGLPKINILQRIQERVNRKYLQEYEFLHLKAERDIKKEAINCGKNIQPSVSDNAVGVTDIIAKMLNDEDGNTEHWQDFIEKDFLQKINEIVSPEIKFERIYTKISSNNYHEIYLEEAKKGGVRLSDCGSGLKTIIATLTLLYIVPRFQSKKHFIFAFEELENNMHPSLERKLLSHISTYIDQHPNNYVFLTTHSNVAIDLFNSNSKAQIVRVSNDGYASTVETVSTDDDKRKTLDELGVKASDLLQSNCVIWVEGPSDRIYIKKWIELFSPNKRFEEGLHYQFLFYGGTLLAHYSAINQDNFINLLKINKNSYIVMDSDKGSKQSRLKDRVRRIRDELGKNYWITSGREIENYIPNNVLSSYFDKDIKLDKFDSFLNLYKQISDIKTFSKVQFASNITSSGWYTLQNLEKHLDLKTKVEELLIFIDKSNLENC